MMDEYLTPEQASHLIPAEAKDSEHEWILIWGSTLSCQSLVLWHQREWCGMHSMIQQQSVDNFHAEPGWAITKAYSAVPTAPCASCDTPILYDYLCKECRG